jgi:HK97 gp10 family phage protein
MPLKMTGGTSMLGKLGRLVKVVTVGRLMYRAMVGPAQLILENAQNRCPVDTGNLRDSIQLIDMKNLHKKQGAIARNADEGIRILAAAIYAINVEYGTSKTQANPFLRPAVDEERAQFVRDCTVFAFEVLVGIWTTPIGAFILSFPIEDIGDKAAEGYVNRRHYLAKLQGKEAPERVAVQQSVKGRLANSLLARQQGARRDYYAARRLERAKKRGGNG